MGILVQQMIDSSFSFIMHTTNPMTDDKNQVYIELAVGQGETLASANQTGTPYRLVYDKTSQQCSIISFSSYSFGLFASSHSNELVKRCIDYTKISFTQDHNMLRNLGAELGQIAQAIEDGFGGEP
jgi:phosphoenolpyruvate synthase/pyruvate phosphate dikinase